MPREAKMSQFSSDKPQVFIPPAFEDFRGYLSVPYDRDVPFQVSLFPYNDALPIDRKSVVVGKE